MRPINDQVIVITGASSGIGRETAIEFSKRGAAVVLAARSAADLQQVAGEIHHHGGQAHVVVTDVSQWEQVERLAQEAVARFGRIDTWVNNAAVAIYATVEQTTVEEIERLIQVNLLGQIYGMKAVLPVMKQQGGGTIVNVASVEAVRALPYHSAYSASKHGVKAFTEALRMELEHEKIPINVVLVLPGSINTPLFNHARSKLGVKPLPMPPIYQPRNVADAIIFAAEHPQRDLFVGGSSQMIATLERISPALVDRLLLTGGGGFKLQKTRDPDDGRDNLFAPMPGSGAVRGDFDKLAKPTSWYTEFIELHPERKPLIFAVATLGALRLLRRGSH